MRVTETLQSRLKDMRPAEADVARRLLRNLAGLAEQSLREVAAACQTSDATVMRACRAAGFDGFQDFKYHVLREFTSGRAPASASAPGAYSDDVAASVHAAGGAVERAARLLRDSRRVALAGVGASQGVALIALDILFTLGRQAIVVQNEQTLAFAFTPPVTGLVLLAISHSGETQFPVRVVRQAREAGVKSIGLSNEPASDLARSVDVYLPTQAVEPPRGSYAIAPRICQLAVLDALFTRVGLPNGRAVAHRT